MPRVERIGDATLYTGDVLEALRAMPDESVNCIVTSPPYWGLRNYDVAGQIGLEPTPEAYVTRMVEVFREARRVLRRDGTCWVNLGDSYAGGGGGNYGDGLSLGQGPKHTTAGKDKPCTPNGLKPKDLCGIPWRVALALQADGWYLRSDIIWAKPNPMPESVTDRPTKAHEYLFLLSREPRYFYDIDAVREQTGGEADPAEYAKGDGHRMPSGDLEHGVNTGFGAKHDSFTHPAGRNRRTVWTIATQPFPEAHFATFPEKLVEPCVLAGCPAQTCPECGAPWERVLSDRPYPRELANAAKAHGGVGNNLGGQRHQDWLDSHPRSILGHRPTCACAREDTVPGTLLDPFCGSGTSLLVALRLGRRAVGIELKPEYMDMTRKRIAEEAAQGKLI